MPTDNITVLDWYFNWRRNLISLADFVTI